MSTPVGGSSQAIMAYAYQVQYQSLDESRQTASAQRTAATDKAHEAGMEAIDDRNQAATERSDGASKSNKLLMGFAIAGAIVAAVAITVVTLGAAAPVAATGVMGVCAAITGAIGTTGVLGVAGLAIGGMSVLGNNLAQKIVNKAEEIAINFDNLGDLAELEQDEADKKADDKAEQLREALGRQGRLLDAMLKQEEKRAVPLSKI